MLSLRPGNYFSLRRDHEKAITYFRRALKLDRSYLSAWTLMGHEYVEIKNTNAAIASYRRAVGELSSVQGALLVSLAKLAEWRAEREGLHMSSVLTTQLLPLQTSTAKTTVPGTASARRTSSSANRTTP